MDVRRRAHLMVAVFVGLLAFHMWLLYRMVNARNWTLAALLVLAIGLFAWRIVHYWTQYRNATSGREVATPEEELRRIRHMAPILAGLLALHAWLITLALAENELAFVVLLLVAVGIFVTRLGYYGFRYRAIRTRR